MVNRFNSFTACLTKERLRKRLRGEGGEGGKEGEVKKSRKGSKFILIEKKPEIFLFYFETIKANTKYGIERNISFYNFRKRSPSCGVIIRADHMRSYLGQRFRNFSIKISFSEVKFHFVPSFQGS